MDISKLKINPDNPRIIKNEAYLRLKRSLKEFPQMLNLRPIIYDNNYIILGGNMRFRILQELQNEGMEIKDNWFIKVSDLTEKQKKEFIIKDNIPFGDWDYDLLANIWSDLPLEDWGININIWQDENFENKNKEIDINELSKDLDLECPKCHFRFKNNV